MKHILLTVLSLAALAIAGCNSSGLESRPSSDQGSYAVATLAPFGSFEWRAAPVYTRLAVLRKQTARRLNRGEIRVETAIEVQSQADSVRGNLDAARAAHDAGKTELAERLLTQAEAWVVSLERFVEVTRK